MAIDQYATTTPGTLEGAYQSISDLNRRLSAIESVRTYVGVETIAGGQIAAGQITSNHVQASAITAGHIEAGSINTVHLAAGAVTTGALAADSVTSAKIAAGQITANHLAAIVTISTMIRTGTAGSRIEIDPSGLRGYDTLNVEKFRFDTATGSLTLTGVVTTLAGSSVAVPHLTGDLGGGNLLRSSAFIDKDTTTGALVLAAANWTTFGVSAASIQTDTTVPFDGANKARITANTAVAGLQQTVVGIKPGDVLTASAYVKSVAAAGRHMIASITWQTSGGANISTDTGTSVIPLTSGWTRACALNFTAPATAAKALVKFATTDAASTEQFEISGPQLEIGGKATGYAPRPGDIADGQIVTAKMVANSISGDRVTASSLAADKIATGTLSSAIVTLTSGGYLQTAGSNPRVVLDNAGLRAINGAGVTVADVNATLATFTGGTFQTATPGSASRVVLDSAGFRAYATDGITERINIAGGAATITGGIIRSSSTNPKVQLTTTGLEQFLSDGSKGFRVNSGGSIELASVNGNGGSLNWLHSDGSNKGYLAIDYNPTGAANGGKSATGYFHVLPGDTVAAAAFSLTALPWNGVGSSYATTIELVCDRSGSIPPTNNSQSYIRFLVGNSANTASNIMKYEGATGSGLPARLTVSDAILTTGGPVVTHVAGFVDDSGNDPAANKKPAIVTGTGIYTGQAVGNYDKTITMPTGFTLMHFIGIATGNPLANYNVTPKGSRRSTATAGLIRFTVATATTDVRVNWIAIGEWP